MTDIIFNHNKNISRISITEITVEIFKSFTDKHGEYRSQHLVIHNINENRSQHPVLHIHCEDSRRRAGEVIH